MSTTMPPNLTHIATTPTPKLSVQPNELGPAGVCNELHILAMVEGDTRTDAERFLDTKPRQFIVDGLLSKTPPTLERIAGDFTQNDGSSYLLCQAGKAAYAIATTHGNFQIRMNENCELSFVHFECTAASVAEAQAHFSAAVVPFLDHCSYVSNTPIFLATARVEDTSNYRTTVSYTAPFMKVMLEDHVSALFESMRPVYAMYREARNASSDFYRFLCWYKILEGLLNSFQARLHKDARAAGKKLSSLRDLLPDHRDYPDDIKPYIGKSVKKLYDEVLTPQFRNAMAHFQTDDGNVLHISDMGYVNRFARIVLPCEMCVRVVIANHEQHLRELGQN